MFDCVSATGRMRLCAAKQGTARHSTARCSTVASAVLLPDECVCVAVEMPSACCAAVVLRPPSKSSSVRVVITQGWDTHTSTHEETGTPNTRLCLYLQLWRKPRSCFVQQTTSQTTCTVVVVACLGASFAGNRDRPCDAPCFHYCLLQVLLYCTRYY